MLPRLKSRDALAPASSLAWPPGLEPARLICHPRARRVILRLDKDGGLVLSHPPGFSRQRLPEIVGQKRAWIERARQALLAVALARGPASLPERLEAPGLGLSWELEQDPQGRPLAREKGARLRVGGEGRAARQALKRWCQRRLGPLLKARLDALAGGWGLPYQGFRAGWQRSRWGSCSRQGRISLSLKLAFLPPELAEYVMAHELCHTRHHHHGQGFWRELEGLHPGARQRPRQLRKAQDLLPAWIDADLQGP
jgi:predicted metal-dependent hydrolase